MAYPKGSPDQYRAALAAYRAMQAGQRPSGPRAGSAANIRRSVGSLDKQTARRAARQQQTSGGEGGVFGGAKTLLGKVARSSGGKVVLEGLRALDVPRSYLASHVSDVAQQVEKGNIAKTAQAVSGLATTDYVNERNRSDFWKHTGVGTYLERGLKKHGLDDTALNNTWVKRGVGFGGDVGLDPLTYLTAGSEKLAGGAGKVGERIAIEEGDRLAAEAAARVAREGGDEVAQEAARAAARKEAAGVGARVVKGGKRALTADEMERYFGTRGGLHLRVPGTGRLARKITPVEEERLLKLLPKEITDKLSAPLGGARDALRGSKLADRLAGKAAGESGADIRALVRSGSEDSAKHGFDLRRAQQMGRSRANAGLILREDGAYADLAKGPEGTKIGPHALDVYKSHVRPAIKGNEAEAIAAVESADAARIESTKGAPELKTFLDELHATAEARGVPLIKREGYVPRQITAEGRDAMDLKGGYATNGAKAGFEKGRRLEQTLGMADASPAEVRAEAERIFQETTGKDGKTFFEQNPDKILPTYIKGLNNRVARKEIERVLLERGSAVKPEEIRQLVEREFTRSESKAVKAQQAVVDKVGGRLSKALDSRGKTTSRQAEKRAAVEEAIAALKDAQSGKHPVDQLIEDIRREQWLNEGELNRLQQEGALPSGAAIDEAPGKMTAAERIAARRAREAQQAQELAQWTQSGKSELLPSGDITESRVAMVGDSRDLLRNRVDEAMTAAADLPPEEQMRSVAMSLRDLLNSDNPDEVQQVRDALYTVWEDGQLKSARAKGGRPSKAVMEERARIKGVRQANEADRAWMDETVRGQVHFKDRREFAMPAKRGFNDPLNPLGDIAEPTADDLAAEELRRAAEEGQPITMRHAAGGADDVENSAAVAKRLYEHHDRILNSPTRLEAVGNGMADNATKYEFLLNVEDFAKSIPADAPKAAEWQQRMNALIDDFVSGKGRDSAPMMADQILSEIHNWLDGSTFGERAGRAAGSGMDEAIFADLKAADPNSHVQKIQRVADMGYPFDPKELEQYATFGDFADHFYQSQAAMETDALPVLLERLSKQAEDPQVQEAAGLLFDELQSSDGGWAIAAERNNPDAWGEGIDEASQAASIVDQYMSAKHGGPNWTNEVMPDRSVVFDQPLPSGGADDAMSQAARMSDLRARAKDLEKRTFDLQQMVEVGGVDKETAAAQAMQLIAEREALQNEIMAVAGEQAAGVAPEAAAAAPDVAAAAPEAAPPADPAQQFVDSYKSLYDRVVGEKAKQAAPVVASPEQWKQTAQQAAQLPLEVPTDAAAKGRALINVMANTADATAIASDLQSALQAPNVADSLHEMLAADDAARAAVRPVPGQRGIDRAAAERVLPKAHREALERAIPLAEKHDQILAAAQQQVDKRVQAALVSEAQAAKAQAQVEMLRMGLDQQKQILHRLSQPKYEEKVFKALDSGMEWLHNSDLAAPREIAEILDRVKPLRTREGWQKFLKGYDTLLNYVKAWQLTTPGFHTRNFMGGMFNNYLAGVDLGAHMNFIRDRRAFYEGKLTGDKAEKMKSLLEHLGAGQYSTSEVNEIKTLSGLGNVQRVNPFSSQNQAFRASGKAGGTVEEVLRGALGWDRLMKGESIDTAVADIAKFHFDYSDLSDFERGTIKRVIPFYSWTRNNLPLQLEMLGQYPGKYSRYWQAKVEIEGDRPAEGVVPDYYLNDLFGIHTGLKGVNLGPLGKAKGDVYLTPDLPFTNTIGQALPDFSNFNPKTAQGWGSLADNYIGQATPLLKMPYELQRNRQVFKGIPFQQGGQPADRTPDYMRNPVGKGLGSFLGSDQEAAYAVEQLLPWLARYRRLVPSESKYQDRQATSSLSTLGVPLRTNTKYEQQMELYRRRLAKQGK